MAPKEDETNTGTDEIEDENDEVEDEDEGEDKPRSYTKEEYDELKAESIERRKTIRNLKKRLSRLEQKDDGSGTKETEAEKSLRADMEALRQDLESKEIMLQAERAGAIDAEDIEALVVRQMKITGDTAAEVITDLKEAKPYLFSSKRKKVVPHSDDNPKPPKQAPKQDANSQFASLLGLGVSDEE